MTRDRGYWAIGVMAIQSEGVQKAIKQEEKRCRMNFKLDCKESRYRTMLMSMETRQKLAVEQRWVEAQYRRKIEELKYQQLAKWAKVWCRVVEEDATAATHRKGEDMGRRSRSPQETGGREEEINKQHGK